MLYFLLFLSIDNTDFDLIFKNFDLSSELIFFKGIKSI